MSIDKGVRHLPLKQLGARMLDVGCGQGAFVSRALSLGWNAEGLDPDPEAVKVGRSKGLRIARGRLSDTCFPDSSFAAVTMSHSIEHLHDPINSLREIYRILEPGGAIWIATPNLDSQGHRMFGRDYINLDPPRHLVLFTPRSLRAALTNTGFKNIVQGRSGNRFWFTLSYRVSQGEAAPTAETGSQLPRSISARAAIADLLSFFRPDIGDEFLAETQ